MYKKLYLKGLGFFPYYWDFKQNAGHVISIFELGSLKLTAEYMQQSCHHNKSYDFELYA